MSKSGIEGSRFWPAGSFDHRGCAEAVEFGAAATRPWRRGRHGRRPDRRQRSWSGRQFRCGSGPAPRRSGPGRLRSRAPPAVAWRTQRVSSTPLMRGKITVPPPGSTYSSSGDASRNARSRRPLVASREVDRSSRTSICSKARVASRSAGTDPLPSITSRARRIRSATSGAAIAHPHRRLDSP